MHMTSSTDPLCGPVFVVGAPRSGTTLTAEILGRSAMLFTGGENHFFEDIYVRWNGRWSQMSSRERQSVIDQLASIYGRYNEPKDQMRVNALMDREPGWRERLAKTSTLGETLHEFMHTQAAEAEKPLWGNHAPKDIFHFESIAACFPESRFVICVRDPRDFLLSYKTHWKVTAETEKARLAALYHPVLTSLLWKASMRQAQHLRRGLPGRVAVVRYEELVAEPRRVIEGLCKALGIPFQPAMLEIARNNSSFSTSSSGIYSSSVGRWKQGLSAEEIRIVQTIASKEMHEWGYEAAPCSPRITRLLATLVAFPAFLIRAFAANSANRGPTAPYVAKRLRALVSGHR